MSRLSTTLLLSALSCFGVAQAQSTKPGLWEITQKMGGNAEVDKAMAQMQQQMAGMSAAEKKMMQDMMARQGMSMPAASAGGGMAMKVCITPEMAAKQDMPVQADGECTTTITSRSVNSLKMTFVCKNPPSTGEGTYTFSGDTAYTMKMLMKTTHQGKPVSMTLDGQGKWLSASCGTVKPLK
ncbi:MAG: DUF3617 domain-containing protein [Hydrogenophaga sp.]|jgi:hypothetical protein|uniref:DUF3617 domain-containing protein n=1 Tax=Hydrogenophaga sp. TaxID=1904254 RepID=UPI002718D427|nr:DUF3617 domain-containing protein [Hydrogenophaga sp.]MDO8887132.1 DUF3617 domain-containing protein [Hydrogenophaga sp.]MDO9133541.1 DUF3617 domain-containing protein [Hydrogenophaga sp.]MDO9504204.1 DUF3617 domain-containing protein [Hydrogenophaga sp.]MDP2252067.1 DUF3617 domain-containing protein [Hydrogenophaga sp.]MDZ4127027.1 DUF3617 domain-containing protein [Hydrogenophaga sp.]